MQAIMNIAFTLPNPPQYYTGNYRADYIAERRFYDMTADYSVFDYMANEAKVVKNTTSEDYFTRGGTNTGLFDFDGALDEERVKKLKEELKVSKSIIWHGVVSFDDTTSIGFTDQDACVRFMQQTFGGFLKNAGFEKDNIGLFCALHEDTDNRHIHFAFYEKSPTRLDKFGRKHFTRRGKIRQEVLDDYLISANMHLSEHGAEYWTARDNAISEMRRLHQNESVAGFIDGRASTQSLLFNAELNALCAKLPETGRLQYNSENIAALRPRIDRVAELMISSDPRTLAAHKEMTKQLARVEEEVIGLAREGKLAYLQGRRMTAADIGAVFEGPSRNKVMDLQFVDPDKLRYISALKADYKARLGNVVLKLCKEYRYKNGGRLCTKFNDRHTKIEARKHRAYRRSLVVNAQRALYEICGMEGKNYLKTVKDHEREIERENKAATRATAE